jgi:Tol biopolymer transport system component
MRNRLHVLLLFGSLIALPALACATLSPNVPDSAPGPTAQPELPPEEAEAVPPGGCPENLGKIVYSYDAMDRASSNYGLYLMNPDGSDRVLITGPDEIHAMEPAWAPERCRIAYKSFTKEGNDDIYAITADGTSFRQLTSGSSWERNPDWSPDGTRIAFLSDRNGIWNLYVMNADGSDVQQVTEYEQDGIDWIDWSPTGDEIAFTYHSTPNDGIPPRIFGIRPDGTALRQIVGFDGEDMVREPAWAPDGKKLYFTRNVPGDIFIWEINADGSGLRQVSNWGPEYDYTHSLHVSPDGAQLAFYGVGPGIEEYREEIYVINADGSGMKAITLTPGNDQWLDW